MQRIGQESIYNSKFKIITLVNNKHLAKCNTTLCYVKYLQVTILQ